MSVVITIAPVVEVYGPPDEDTAPCLSCGRECCEQDIELSEGFCPYCGARWVGTHERASFAASVPYTVLTGEDNDMEDIPI